jgi:hypothetical protein
MTFDLGLPYDYKFGKTTNINDFTFAIDSIDPGFFSFIKSSMKLTESL